MNRIFKVILLVFFLCIVQAETNAQCSLCTRNAEQLGDKAAAGLNLSILFLAFTPLILIAYIGYKWYKNEKDSKED